MKKSILASVIIFFISFLLNSELLSKEYTRIDTNWKFIKTDIANAFQPAFADSTWETVTLPHIWNALDGQDGGGNYYRGIGWYRKHVLIHSSFAGKVVYLKIGAANTRATVYLNGILLGTHFGGYSAFIFDISNYIRLEEDNVIAIQVNNSSSIICPPLSADFNHDGGITRDVNIITASPLHINPNESISNSFTPTEIKVAQSGIILKQSHVSQASANLSIITKLRNASADTDTAKVEVAIKDAIGNTVKLLTDTVSVAPNDTATSILNTTFINPHLWDGLNDPYLYRVEVSLKQNGQIIDSSVQPLGFRYFSIDPNTGFYLNGKSYPLRGISLHESKINKGHAVLDADRKESIDLLRETGCNYFRLSHYQHGDFTYNYLDSLGIICWTEIPDVNSVGKTSAENTIYKQNAVSEMYELLRQQYNHPCIIFWGLSNEINFQATISPVSTVDLLNKVVKSEDTYRITTLAAMYAEKETNWIPDVYSNNRYDGWYSSSISGFASTMDALHANYPTKKIGVSEYGAGANPLQHEYPAAQPSPGGQWHPEEYQNLFHEQYLKAINARPYLWSTSMWIGIDFAVDNRNEGMHPGINDKGMISFDRTIKKDIFYWYKANWNTKDWFVYITSRRFINRTNLINPVKMYSNCDSVSIVVNGKIYPPIRSSDHIFIFDSIPMLSGYNHIVAQGYKSNLIYRDSVDWNCVNADTIPTYPAIPAGSIEINFQKSGASTPVGYLVDDGSLFGNRQNGFSYGWNVDNTANARVRNLISDKRFDTFIHMQLNGTYSWSISLPNHLYRVSIACGDPEYTDSYHKIEANGISVVNFFPSNTFKYGAGTANVDVTNGMMTIKPATSSINAKISFIHISPVDTTQTSIHQINTPHFQVYQNSGNIVVKSETNDKKKILIYNISGQMVHEQSIADKVELISTDKLKQGIYFVELETTCNLFQTRLIIQ